MLTSALAVTYACLLSLLMLLRAGRRITDKQFTGWVAIVYGFAAALCAVNGWRALLYLNVGLAAWFGWLWWHSGGGDGPRRRLKAWAGRFHGVRRTAPASA